MSITGEPEESASVAGIVARSEGPPAIWPLSHPKTVAYATSGKLQFGWDVDGFRIESFSLLRTKKIFQSSLTEEGWYEAWSKMESAFPELASATRAVSAGPALRAARSEQIRQKQAEAEEELARRGSLAHLEGCTLLGGYGFHAPLAGGSECRMIFLDVEAWITLSSSLVPLLRIPYSAIEGLEFSGPGKVTTGGGFIGGGFGLSGAAKGMIAASVLNALTTKTKIHTMIRCECEDLELFFFYSTQTPDQLRIGLSEVLGKLRHPPQAIPASNDLLGKIERLIELRSGGLLSEEEFVRLKEKLIAGV
jgi:hypothetical protein